MFAPLALRVYLEDTDAGGVVYHASYVRFLERARTEALRATGLEQSRNFERDQSFVVSRMNLQFLAAAILDDELVVSCDVKRTTAARLVFEQEVRDAQTGTRIFCRAEVEVACLNLKTRRPQRLPPLVRDAFRAKGA